jgi:hypothetical protein
MVLWMISKFAEKPNACNFKYSALKMAAIGFPKCLYAVAQKAAGSIPDGVSGIFH